MSGNNGLPWPTLPLGRLAAEMCLGKMLDKAKNRGNLQPYLRNVNVRWFAFDLTDMKEMRFEDHETIRFGLKPGDLVICEGGEPGRAAVWSGQCEEALIQKALHRVRFRPDEYDPTFAMYYVYFGTTTNRFSQYYTGTTIKHLTGKALSQVQFPVPPFAEQRRIVAKIEELFSDLDAGVAALKRAKAKLKQYRASVLKAAVEGRLTKQWRADNPDVEPASKLLKRILQERRKKWEAEQLRKFKEKGKEPPKNWKAKYKEPDSVDTTTLPALPEAWCWASVEQIVEIGTGTTPLRSNQSYWANGTIPWVTSTAVNRPFVHEGNEFVTELALKETTLTRYPANTLILALYGEGKTRGKVSELLIDATINQALASLQLVGHAAYCRDYLKAFLHSNYEEMRRGSEGGVQPNLNLSKVRSIRLPLPPTEEQKAITERIDEEYSRLKASESLVSNSLVRATRLRQSILKRAFEGKLVPQDPNDEPAATLLERICSKRNGKPLGKAKQSQPRKSK